MNLLEISIFLNQIKLNSNVNNIQFLVIIFCKTIYIFFLISNIQIYNFGKYSLDLSRIRDEKVFIRKRLIDPFEEIY